MDKKTKNYALNGNPNEFFTRKQALDYLVDACINVEECEWASCSVRLVGVRCEGKVKTKADALKDIREVAGIVAVEADDLMLLAAYDTIKDNLL
jgi:hypothetical protein